MLLGQYTYDFFLLSYKNNLHCVLMQYTRDITDSSGALKDPKLIAEIDFTNGSLHCDEPPLGVRFTPVHGMSIETISGAEEPCFLRIKLSGYSLVLSSA